MPYCPKCGAEVSEEMAFCPKCGASLKVEAAAAPAPPRRAEKEEKQEKQEKEEKGEKTEKHEKREFGVIGPLIGGLVLIFLGLVSYLQISGVLLPQDVSALFFVAIGIIIIFVSVYVMMVAKRRSPRT